MGYFYEDNEVRYAYCERERIREIVSGYVPSLENYQKKMGHSEIEAKRLREEKVEQDTMALVILQSALRKCVSINVSDEALKTFIADNLEIQK